MAEPEVGMGREADEVLLRCIGIEGRGGYDGVLEVEGGMRDGSAVAAGVVAGRFASSACKYSLKRRLRTLYSLICCCNNSIWGNVKVSDWLVGAGTFELLSCGAVPEGGTEPRLLDSSIDASPPELTRADS